MRENETVFRQKTPLLSEEKAGATAEVLSLPSFEAAGDLAAVRDFNPFCRNRRPSSGISSPIPRDGVPRRFKSIGIQKNIC